MEIQSTMMRSAILVGAIYSVVPLLYLIQRIFGRRKLNWVRLFVLIIIVAVLLGVLALPPLVLTIFVALLVFSCVREILHAAQVESDAFASSIFYVFSMLISISIPFLFQFRAGWFHVFAIIALIVLLSLLFLQKDMGLALRSLAWSIVGIALSILLSHLVLLRSLPNGLSLCVLVIFLTNLTDSLCYFFGQAFGGQRKLAKTISPGKTLVGSLSSIPAILLLSLLFRWQLFSDVPVWYVLLIAFIINIGAQLGDLFFSMIKRGVGVDDYGQMIPGHGGVLDRVDSLVITAPLVYCLLSLLPWPG